MPDTSAKVVLSLFANLCTCFTNPRHLWEPAANFLLQTWQLMQPNPHIVDSRKSIWNQIENDCSCRHPPALSSKNVVRISFFQFIFFIFTEFVHNPSFTTRLGSLSTPADPGNNFFCQDSPRWRGSASSQLIHQFSGHFLLQTAQASDFPLQSSVSC